MRKKDNFYVIYGNNAVGIYDNYNLCLSSKKYVKSWNCKKFQSWEEAVEYAIDYVDEAGYKYELNIQREDFSLNRVLYYKNFVMNM